MFRFPKVDLSKFAIPEIDLSKFELPDPARYGMGSGNHAARTARMKAAMARIQREQAAAFARWAEQQPHADPADPAGPADSHAQTIDMQAPATPGGAWTAPKPDRAGAPDEAAKTSKASNTAEATRTAKPDGAKADAAKVDWAKVAGAKVAGAKVAGAKVDLSAMMRALRENLPAGGIPAGGGASVAVPDGARFEERSFTGPAGTRSYKVYVPSGYTGQRLPLVVMLHGCSQNPDDFAAGTQMNAVAEEQTFLVAYPGQSQSANMQRCWNWYAAGDQGREGGEPELIAGIARAVIDEFSADPSRVYAAGLSAGGAAAAILAATYPDLFAAVGVHSGLACGSARDMPSAFAAMKGQAAVTGRNRQAVPTIVFHGDGDRTVHPANGDQVIAQARAAGDLAAAVTKGTSPGGIAYTRTVRSDASGSPLLEQWILHGVGHAWSGGSPAGSYTEPRGPDASRAMMRFFLSHTRQAGAGA